MSWFCKHGYRFYEKVNRGLGFEDTRPFCISVFSFHFQRREIDWSLISSETSDSGRTFRLILCGKPLVVIPAFAGMTGNYDTNRSD